jgi:hypothetical protein
MCGGQRARPPLRARPQRTPGWLAPRTSRNASTWFGQMPGSRVHEIGRQCRRLELVQLGPSRLRIPALSGCDDDTQAILFPRTPRHRPSQVCLKLADLAVNRCNRRAPRVASWDLIRKGMWRLGPAAACTGETSRGAAAAPRTCSSQFYATPDPRGVVATIPT